MATTKNITMKQFNGTDYDTLYPKTVYNQVSGVAPAGYGLGSEYGGYIDDFNTKVKTGWYIAAASSLNPPVDPAGNVNLAYGVLRVEQRENTIFQYYSNERYSAVIKLQRISTDKGSTWGEWEFINPQMKTGIEYRTTERFDGKPVYCQLVYFTNVVDGGTVDVNVPGVDTVLRFFGSRSGVPLPFISEKGLNNAWTNYFSVNRFTDKITITMNAGSSVPSESRFYCTLYYTKSS